MEPTEAFHGGERQIQARTLETEEAELNAQVIADRLIKGVDRFLHAQRWAVISSLDRHRYPWVSILFSERPFITTPDDHHVQIDLTAASPHHHDPLFENLGTHPDVGLLFIEFHRRRRLRLNGTLKSADNSGLTIRVSECYPNCPKYIQARHFSIGARSDLPSTAGIESGTLPGAAQQRTIRCANTLFIGSHHPDRGMDASHRGGPEGFVEFRPPSTLSLPDYKGNSMFNTLGNLHVNNTAGLLLLDLTRNKTLQMTGSTNILFDQEDGANRSGGTRRFLEFAATQFIELPLPVAINEEFLGHSPYNPPRSS